MMDPSSGIGRRKSYRPARHKGLPGLVPITVENVSNFRASIGCDKRQNFAGFLRCSFHAKRYPLRMTKLLDKALERVRRLPSENQDEIARAMLQFAGNDAEPEIIDAAHLSAVLEGLGQRSRGEYATDEEVEAAFRRFDR
jgi:hypothetical protein